MAEIDGSIAVNANRPQNNPLEMAGQIVGVRNALLQGQQQQQALQRGQIDISQAQVDLAQKRLQGLGTYFSQLYARPNLTKADMIQAAADGVNLGLFTDKEASIELAHVPEDNAGIHDHIKQLIFSTMDQAQRFNAIAPPPSVLPTGGQNVIGTFPAVGKPNILGTISNTVPPTQTRVNPNQGYQQETVGGATPQVTGDIGVAGAATGGAAAQPAPTATGTPAISPQASAGPIVTAPPPETAPYRQAAAGRATALAQANSNVPATKAILQNMQAEQTSLPPELFGPGSHFTQKAGQLFAEVGGQSQQIGALDAWVKNAQQLANELLPSIGNSSDRSQMAAFASNPNQYLSKNGIARIQALLMGTADANAAKNRAFQTSGTLPGDYNKWESDFNQHFDPRVFQWQYMTKEQKAETVTQLGGKNSKAFKDFAASFNRAAHSGELPTIQPQGQ